MTVVQVLRDCNAKSKNWCKADITSLEVSMVDTVASSYGLNQLFQEPTHILNSSTSCIDLIFTLQPTLVMKSKIHSLLHSNCCHQVVSAKFNLSNLRKKTVWYYKKANTELIKRAIDQFDWSSDALMKTLFNVIQNVIPHKQLFLLKELRLR